MVFQGYLLIIGAMKSGTTTLHQLLRQHPAIVRSAGTPFGSEKEPNIFKALRAPTPAEVEAFYPALDKRVHAWTLDASPDYTKHRTFPGIARRIAAFPGKTRLIYILRDPIERIDSHIAHNVRKGRWTATDFDRALLLDTSSYARQIEIYARHGLRENLLLVDFAELSARPRETVARVEAFLGLPHAEIRDVGAQHQRRDKTRFVDAALADDLRAALVPDVARLISDHGFAAAKTWGVLPEGHPLLT